MKISQAQDSRTDGPARFSMHSIPGFGKTTLVAHMPRVVFLANENQNIPRDLPFKVKVISGFKSWEDVLDTIVSLTNDEHPYMTAAIDTLDWLEPLIYEYVCRRDSGRETEMNPKGRKLESIEDYGFQKGYIVAEEEFRRLVWKLDVLQHRRGMHVAMLMHSHVKEWKNPGGANFDRWQPKVHPRIANVVNEWCETMLFGFFEAFASKDKDEAKKVNAKVKGNSTGRRMLGTVWNATYDAKNRSHMPAEVELRDPREIIPYVLGENLHERGPDDIGADARPHEGRVPTRTADRVPTPAAPEPRSSSITVAVVAGAHDDAQDIIARERKIEPADSRAELRGEVDRRPPERTATNGTSADPARTDARTWTEAKAPPAAPPPAASDTITRDLTDALSRSQKLGRAYYEQIAAWSKEAGGDERKLRKLIAKIDSDLAQTAGR